MDYTGAIEYIHSTYKFGIKLGLENIRNLMDLMGNPQKELQYIHVAGTNGKGSVSAFVANILVEAGFKVGLYTSPYIYNFEERIQINNKKIGKEELIEMTLYVKEKIELLLKKGFNHPTEFETVTAIAYKYFFEQKCDIVVLEVGLGGRYDSTNVIDKSEVSVINVIDFDHMDRLGNTLMDIAYDKAGIIKESGDVVLYDQNQEVVNLVKCVCIEKNATLMISDFSVDNLESKIDSQKFDYKKYRGLELALNGEYQVNNAIMAINVIHRLVSKGYEISEKAIKKGLKETRWPGRFEIIHKSPYILLDGSHNVQGITSLKYNIKSYFGDSKKVFILSVMEDKEYEKIIEILTEISDLFVVFESNNKRAVRVDKLALVIKRYCKNIIISDTIDNAIKEAFNYIDKDGLICISGTFSIIAEAKRAINKFLNL